VAIDFNKNKKPKAISIIGSTFSSKAAAELLVNVIQLKVNQGYNFSDMPFKWTNGNDAIKKFEKEFQYPSKSNNIEKGAITWVAKITMKKGNMRFEAEVGTESYPGSPDYPEYHWGIITSDINRQDGNVTSKSTSVKKAFHLDF